MAKLPDEVRVWADKIYQSDRQKFQKLILWLMAANRTYSPEVVAETLRQFEPMAKSVSSEWWGYLDKILDKTEGRINGSKAETESEQHKNESLGQFGAIMDRIAQSRKGLP
jgi:hypothetical protein